MATKKKMLQAAAGNAAGGGPLDITDVFSNYLYTGTGANKIIDNGINLLDEGGMVWGKSRTSTYKHCLFDTERGAGNCLSSNLPNASVFETGVTQFRDNGFKLEPWAGLNQSNGKYVSWTFRKAPKFFDVQTWTGDSSSNKAISHNLGSTPGMIIVKRTNNSEDWGVWHRDVHSGTSKVLYLNQNFNLQTSSGIFGPSSPNDTNFYVGGHPVSNNSGDSYVAYIFAHNNSDGEFGPDSDQDVIKCGSYYGNGGIKNIDLGFEPQWVIIKNTSRSNFDWSIYDSMRRTPSTLVDDVHLKANGTNTDFVSNDELRFTSSGFECILGDGRINTNSDTYVYMAIRRGPLTPPESGDEVFAMDTWGGGPPGYSSGFVTDLGIHGAVDSSTGWTVNDRYRHGRKISTHQTQAENNSSNGTFDFMDGFWNSGATLSNYQAWMWKRAPGFFDMVAFKGDQYSNQDVTHNLTVKPELVITKLRGDAVDWEVAAKITSTTYHRGILNSSGSLSSKSLNQSGNAYSQFSNNHVQVGGTLNGDGDHYIMYLFATLPGVSKVGTFSTSSDLVVDCGFTAGARFVLFKRVPTGSANWDSWFVFDADRGITNSADQFIEFDTANAGDTDGNNIELHASGFKVKSGPNLNLANGDEIIFYAIA